MNEYLGNEELGKHAEIPGIGLVSGILGGLVSLTPAGDGRLAVGSWGWRWWGGDRAALYHSKQEAE